MLNICGNNTYLTKIEEKTIRRGDSRPKLTLNYSSPIDQKEEKSCDGYNFIKIDIIFLW
jgi:hypothetical protein